MGLFDFFTQEIAIDLGTANTLIIHNNKVVVDNTSISVTTNRKTVGDVVRNTGNFNGKTASTEVIDEVLNEYDSKICGE